MIEARSKGKREIGGRVPIVASAPESAATSGDSVTTKVAAGEVPQRRRSLEAA